MTIDSPAGSGTRPVIWRANDCVGVGQPQPPELACSCSNLATACPLYPKTEHFVVCYGHPCEGFFVAETLEVKHC
jgi:hypothetical protein